MARPLSVYLVYADNPEHPEDEFRAEADGSHGSWGEFIRNNNVRLANTHSSRPPNTMYVVDGRKFSLHCRICFNNGCNSSELNKAPTHGWSPGWDSNFLSGHKHSRVTQDPEFHNRDANGEWCRCTQKHQNSSGKSRKSKRNISVDAKLTMSVSKVNGTYPIFLELPIPVLHKSGTKEEIGDQESLNIAKLIENKLGNQNFIDKISYDHGTKTIHGELISLPATGSMLLLGKIPLQGTDAKAIAMSIFDRQMLRLLVWEKNDTNELEPIKLDSGISSNSVKITLNRSRYYIWENHPVLKNDKQLPGILENYRSRNLNNPLTTICGRISREDVKTFCDNAFKNQGYEKISFPELQLDVQIHKLKQGLDNINALLFVSSKSQNNESINIEIRRIGGEDLIFGNDESLFAEKEQSESKSKFDKGLHYMFDDNKQVVDKQTGITILPKQRRIIGLNVKGIGRLTVRTKGTLILDQKINGFDAKNLEIKRVNLDYETFQKLIPEIMDKSSVKGFEEYSGLPGSNYETEEL